MPMKKLKKLHSSFKKALLVELHTSQVVVHITSCNEQCACKFCVKS